MGAKSSNSATAAVNIMSATTSNFRRYHYVLAPETSDEETSDSDKTTSVYSMQDKETEYVRDESDTCTKSDASEYTLYSLPSEKNPLVDSDSSEEFIIKTEKIIVDIHTSTLSSGSEEHELDSTMGSSEDSELGQADYWYCAQCNKSNNHPKYRYCMKCFRLRKEMFPPKPKATKKRRGAADNNNVAAARGLCKKRKRAERSSVENSDEDLDATLGGVGQAKSVKLDSTMKLDTFIGKFGNLAADSQIFSRMCDEADEIRASKRLKQSDECLTPVVSLGNPVQNQGAIGNSVQNQGASKAATLGANSNVNTNSMTTKSLIGKFETMNTSSQFFGSLCESVDKVYEKALNEHLADGSDQVDKVPGKVNRLAEPCSNANRDVTTITTCDTEKIDESERIDESGTSALCIMCDKAPKNGAFVHMYEAHVCCCYPCALKVWKQTKKCPTCNLPAFKVVKMIIS